MELSVEFAPPTMIVVGLQATTETVNEGFQVLPSTDVNTVDDVPHMTNIPNPEQYPIAVGLNVIPDEDKMFQFCASVDV